MILSLIFPSFILEYGWENGYILLGFVVFILTTPVGAFLLRSKPADIGIEAYGQSEASSSDTPDVQGVSYKRALKSPQLWVCAFAFLILAITVIVTQHLAAYFVSIGFDAVTAGIFMSVISAGIIITNIGAGMLSDRIGLMRAFLVCSILYLISFLLLPSSALIPVICVALVLMSIGNANTTLFAPMITQSVFGTKDYASLWGIISMASVLGQAIGAPLWGLVFDLYGSYAPGMYISSIIVLIAYFGLAWISRNVVKEPTP